MMALVPALPNAKEAATGARVYVVDDSLSVRKAIEHMLGPRGHRVTGGGSGEQALAELAEATPDLVICDIVLPDADGLEICRFVRGQRRLRSVPVIAISGIVDEDVRRRSRDAGADAVLRKPFSGDDLVRQVEDLLAARQPAEPEPSPRPRPSPPRPVPAVVEAALERLEGLRELRFALVLDETGVVARVGGAPPAGDDREHALVDLVGVAGDLSPGLTGGALRGLMIESEDGLLLVWNAGSAWALVLCLDGAALLGRARYYARRVAADLAAALDG